MNCIFCKIIAKEIPSYTLYEDDDFIAILDRYPTTCGHTLIIPKRHSDDLFGLDDNTLQKLMPLTAKIAGALRRVLKCDGLNLIQNNGAAAGQSVPHFHMHIIPRHTGDNIPLSIISKDASTDELEDIRGKIAKEL